jgi:hypothetical protein
VAAPPAVRGLHVLATVEALSLVVLAGNRVLVGSDGLPSLLGPLHGFCYLGVVALAFALRADLGLPPRAAWWAVLPGVGGLVVWWLSRRSATMTAP